MIERPGDRELGAADGQGRAGRAGRCERTGDRLMRMLALIAVWLSMSAEFAYAQAEHDGRLKGVTKIRLLVEDLSKGSELCGITSGMIRDAFMYPVSSSKLQISDQNPDARFYIRVTTLDSHVSCKSEITIKIYLFQYEKLPFSDLGRSYDVELWSEQSIFTSDVNEHAQIIREGTENMTKDFVTAWNLDNKPQ
jgi:hypothetical protein